MTFIISHRGNINGPGTAPGGENSLVAIMKAITNGFDVEIDVLGVIADGDNHILQLGHDYDSVIHHADFRDDKVRTLILFNSGLFLHAKTMPALCFLINQKIKHGYYYDVFCHDTDIATITKNGCIWMYPNHNLDFTGYNKAIDVLPEQQKAWIPYIANPWGICTDFPISYDKLYNKE